MKAVCWYGKHDVRVKNVPDPEIMNSRDAIIKITTTAICGSICIFTTLISRRWKKATFSDTSLWAKSLKLARM